MCSTQMRVNSRRAVSKSSSTLPSRHSWSSSAASLWIERRAMSIVSQPFGRIGADGFEIAFADREIVAHRPLEPGEAEADRLELAPFLVLHDDGEAIVLDAQQDPERPLLPLGLEEIALEQIEDGDLALLLDLVAAADDRPLVQLDVDDPRLAHERVSSGGGVARLAAEPIPLDRGGARR